MRTERFLAVGRLGALGMAIVVSAFAQAADVDFDPTVDVNVFYDGNATGVGETDPSVEGPDPSAIVGGIGVNLPWTVRTPSTTFTFSYRPRREVYNDEQRPDFTSHAVNASVAKTVSPRASYSVGLDYNRSDRQELDPLRPSNALTYLERRTFQSGGVNAAGTFSAGRRSTLSWRAGGNLQRGEDLPDSTFDDSETYNAGFGWTLNYSAQASAGLGMGVQRFSYETRSAVNVVSLGVLGSRSFSREGTFNYAVGALRSNDADVTNVAGSVDLNATWTLGQHASLGAGVRQGASAGDGVSGASLDRGGYVTWSYARPRGFTASVNTAYWNREFLNDTSAEPQPPSAFTISDSVSWRLGRFFRLGFFHTYRDQNVSAQGDPALATSYHTAGVSGTWILRGERREGA